MNKTARITIAGLTIALSGFVPPASFALNEARTQAAGRKGVQAVYVADGRRIDLIIDAAGAARFDAGLPPGVAEIVTDLLAGRPGKALRRAGGDPTRSALTLWLGEPSVAVGIAGPRERGPRVLLHPERFVPLGLFSGGLQVRLRGVDGMLSAFGLPMTVEVEIEGKGTWTAHLAAAPTKAPIKPPIKPPTSAP